jgi:hypothetical protein
VVWAVPDHPWVDETGSADVTVAMTVVSDEPTDARRIEVDADGQVLREVVAPRLNADLSANADIGTSSEQPLVSNSGLAANGFIVYGRGFALDEEEAGRLASLDPGNAAIIRSLRNGRDLTARSRNLYVIDFGLRHEAEARQYEIELLSNVVDWDDQAATLSVSV